MGTDPGTNIGRLIEKLQANPTVFDFFQAIYLAERQAETLHARKQGDRLTQQGLRFRPYEHYAYFPKSIKEAHFDGQAMEFIATFFGLYGGDSPLPRCYHQQVALQQKVHGRNKVPLQNFLDIFNNRFYWLFYQAWKKYRFYLQLEDKPDNIILQRIFTFVGCEPEYFRRQTLIDPYHILQFSGILSCRVRNKRGLLILLREFFPRFPVAIREFVPGMVKVDEKPKMGSRNGGQGFRLGQNSMIGNSVLDYMSRILIQLGPMDFSEYLEFLPGQQNVRLLNELLRLYLNDELEFDLQILIRSSSIKGIPWNDKRVRLGQSFWMGTPKTESVSMYFNYEKLTAVKAVPAG